MSLNFKVVFSFQELSVKFERIRHGVQAWLPFLDGYFVLQAKRVCDHYDLLPRYWRQR